MGAYDPYQYDKLEELLKQGLAPFGITPENIQDNAHRVCIIQYPPEVYRIVCDVSVDDRYVFSIIKELKHVEVTPGVTRLMVDYKMVVEGENDNDLQNL